MYFVKDTVSVTQNLVFQSDFIFYLVKHVSLLNVINIPTLADQQQSYFR